ncbi:MAG: arsenic efflux protein [Bacilli bacterium]|nr:arsenic efflux protein [Bacilli bacterium]
MIDIILDTLIDLLKIIPFLFAAFLIMEYFEHNLKSKKLISNKKYGPLLGSILGAVPQCGFSVMATNLYGARVITIGTLMAVYLSTSDEMLPLLISNHASIKLVITIILIKIIIGIIFGYLLDLFYKKENKNNYEICKHDHCHCDDNIFKSSIIHTLKISLYILITTFILNTLIYYLGEENISNILLKNNFFGPFLSSLVGLIPNCSASVILTELYINNIITTGMLIGGLLTGSGIGILVLFKVNKNKKENFMILLFLYIIGVIIGILIDLFKIIL